jgi:hypothetical protein
MYLLQGLNITWNLLAVSSLQANKKKVLTDAHVTKSTYNTTSIGEELSEINWENCWEKAAEAKAIQVQAKVMIQGEGDAGAKKFYGAWQQWWLRKAESAEAPTCIFVQIRQE